MSSEDIWQLRFWALKEVPLFWAHNSKYVGIQVGAAEVSTIMCTVCSMCEVFVFRR